MPEWGKHTHTHTHTHTERSVFKKNPFYISCPYRAEVADTVCTPDCARCQNRENTHIHTHTHTHTHTDHGYSIYGQTKYCNPRACAPRVDNKKKNTYVQKTGEPENDANFLKHNSQLNCSYSYPSKPRLVVTVFRLHIYGLSRWF